MHLHSGFVFQSYRCIAICSVFRLSRMVIADPLDIYFLNSDSYSLLTNPLKFLVAHLLERAEFYRSPLKPIRSPLGPKRSPQVPIRCPLEPKRIPPGSNRSPIGPIMCPLGPISDPHPTKKRKLSLSLKRTVIDLR